MSRLIWSKHCLQQRLTTNILIEDGVPAIQMTSVDGARAFSRYQDLKRSDLVELRDSLTAYLERAK